MIALFNSMNISNYQLLNWVINQLWGCIAELIAHSKCMCNCHKSWKEKGVRDSNNLDLDGSPLVHGIESLTAFTSHGEVEKLKISHTPMCLPSYNLFVGLSY